MALRMSHDCGAAVHGAMISSEIRYVIPKAALVLEGELVALSTQLTRWATAGGRTACSAAGSFTQPVHPVVSGRESRGAAPRPRRPCVPAYHLSAWRSGPSDTDHSRYRHPRADDRDCRP